MTDEAIVEARSDVEEPREKPPADLVGSVRIQLHTRQGYFLVFSRRTSGEASPVVGLYRFAKRMGIIWTASAHDDPFADMFLDRVYAGLMNAKRELEDHEARVARMLDRAKESGLVVELASSAEPVEAELRFSTPYGFMGADLVVRTDRFVRMCHTCRHVALMSVRECHQHVDWAVKLVARTFFLSTGFKITGVTRSDWREQNARWREALATFGGRQPPVDILEGRRRPIVSPPIEQTGSVQTERRSD